MTQLPLLGKSVWSNDDFEVMGWHDAHLYGFLVMPDTLELAFDIDYIVQWVHPTPPETFFAFWVSPATLIFKDVHEISVQIDMEQLHDLEIEDLHRQSIKNREGDFRWALELSQGKVAFSSTGYTQFFRSKPALIETQSLGMEKRNGVSFSRDPFRQT